jgi:hypothetical protein
MTKAGKISLLLADVDGTLATRDKVLTPRAQDAVRNLHAAGIRFAITSGRPPKGMAMLIEPLALERVADKLGIPRTAPRRADWRAPRPPEIRTSRGVRGEHWGQHGSRRESRGRCVSVSYGLSSRLDGC